MTTLISAPVLSDAGQSQIKNEGTELLKGHFTLYYDDVYGTRHPVVPDPTAPTKATPWPTPPAGLVPGKSMAVQPFTPPSDPDPTPKMSNDYVLVFQGDMGEEKALRDAEGKMIGGAITAKVVMITPASFFTPRGRLRYESPGLWRLTLDAPLQYGNVDWRGTAGSVSWVGPHGRHVQQIPAEELSNQIFSKGKLLATAPGPVLGAAIQHHPQTGALTLLAVVATVRHETYQSYVTAETVYATPLPLPDPVEWESLGSSAEYVQGEGDGPRQDYAPAHYFFNASGTKAVSVKGGSWSSETGGSSRRTLFVEVEAGAAQAQFTFRPLVDGSQYTGGRGDCDVQGESICLLKEWVEDWTSSYIFAADYRGEELVELYHHRHTHDEGRETDTNRGEGIQQWRYTYSYSTHSQDRFEMTGWVWPRYDYLMGSIR